jgi:hypothetical protein
MYGRGCPHGMGRGRADNMGDRIFSGHQYIANEALGIFVCNIGLYSIGTTRILVSDKFMPYIQHSTLAIIPTLTLSPLPRCI